MLKDIGQICTCCGNGVDIRGEISAGSGSWIEREDSEALLESISSLETDSESSFSPEEVRVQFNRECCSSAGIKFCVRFRNGTGIDLDPVLDKNQNNQHIQE
jgi:hypothetical protein